MSEFTHNDGIKGGSIYTDTESNSLNGVAKILNVSETKFTDNYGYIDGSSIYIQ